MPCLRHLALSLAGLAALTWAEQTTFSTHQSDLGTLAEQAGLHVLPGAPFASACFSNTSAEDRHNWRAQEHLPDPLPGLNSTSKACDTIMANYLDEFSRTAVFGAQIQPQWEGCQKTGEMCLLNWRNPQNLAAGGPSQSCKPRGTSSYYIDVQTPEDVKHAFEFSKAHKVPLVIKNTGHDYKGRSSAPNSLGLWMHNLKDIKHHKAFVPEGCTESYEAITMGAGVQWGEAYALAEANNITLSGGSDLAVGTVGGWLQGGGHGALSNTLGMGVDNVLQFKVVTPDGEYRTVNACQNPDLWFALRGGGGSTFGVVMEATQRATPQVTLQVSVVKWNKVDQNQSTPLTRELFSILVDNAIQWADDGYGAFVWPETVIYVTPKLSKERALLSMRPLLDFGRRLQDDNVTGATVFQGEFPSWFTFYNTFAGANAAKMGIPLALASRLVPRDNFATPESRSELVDALMAAHADAPLFRLLMGPPSSYPGDNTSSVHDAWRTAIFHTTLVTIFPQDATPADMAATYDLADRAIDHVRRLTPDAAYTNEASIHEPNHEETFWGRHYPRLLEIKRKYDPDHLLDCWHCVGWDATSPRFACYP